MIPIHHQTTGRRRRSVDLLEGLAPYWSLDESSNGTIATTRLDSNGSNDLTDNNTVASASGKVGNAASFVSANSEFLAVANNADLQVGDISWTGASWVRIDALNTSNPRIMGKVANGSWRMDYLALTRQRFRVVIFNTDGSVSAVDADSFGLVVLGEWVFVVGWHDADNDEVAIQINNGPVDIATTGGKVPRSSTSDFRLGGDGGTAGNRLDGLLDEVAMWRRVLSSRERAWLYNSGNGRQYSEL